MKQTIIASVVHRILNNFTDLVLGPCLHSLRDLEVRLSVDRHLSVFVWYEERDISGSRENEAALVAPERLNKL